MTASKTLRTALTRFRRTVTRTLRRLAFKGASATLTFSLPPFIKLEIKAETEKAKPAHRGRRLA